MRYPPVLSISRNSAGRLFIGLDEFDQETGYAVRSAVLCDQGEYVADSVMFRRFEDMRRLMAGNIASGSELNLLTWPPSA